MMWDFAEAVPLAIRAGHFDSAVRDGSTGSLRRGLTRSAGQVQPADAADHPLPDETASVWFTDPPYYDAVPYADLSDFFYRLAKRALAGDPRSNPLIQLNALLRNDARACGSRPQARRWPTQGCAHFEKTMARAFAKDGGCCVRMASAASSLLTRQLRDGKRCSQA